MEDTQKAYSIIPFAGDQLELLFRVAASRFQDVEGVMEETGVGYPQVFEASGAVTDFYRSLLQEPASQTPVFLCVWGEGYARPSQDAKIELHGAGFFSSARGYGRAEQARIRELVSVGQGVTFADGFTAHTVVRIR